MTRKMDLMLKKYNSVSFIPQKKTICHLQIFYSYLLSTSLIEILLSSFFLLSESSKFFQFSKFVPELFKTFTGITEMANPDKTCLLFCFHSFTISILEEMHLELVKH